MKITPEIEAVARALCWANGMNPDLTLGGDGQNFLWHEYERPAVAAIRALRDPSDHMTHDGARDLLLDEPLRDEDARSVFITMIDAALGENK